MRRGRGGFRGPGRRGMARRRPHMRPGMRPVRRRMPVPMVPLMPPVRAYRRWRRPRRWLRGPFSMLLFGASAAAAYKLLQGDVDRIEYDMGTSADELTEEELLAAMERLGIQKLELDDDDVQEIERQPFEL